MDETSLTLALAVLILAVALSDGSSSAWLPGLALIPLASKVPHPL